MPGRPRNADPKEDTDLKDAIELIRASDLPRKDEVKLIDELKGAYREEQARISAQSEANKQRARRILSGQLEQLKNKADPVMPGVGRIAQRNDSEPPRDIAFFSDGGLSEKTDGLEITICFDYELARESADVVQFIQKLQHPEEKAERILTKWILNPYIARWAGGCASGQEEESRDAPLIPTICLAAAKSFPGPWLTIPSGVRRKLVKRFAPVYDSFRPLIISEGHESGQQTVMRDKAMSSDNQNRGHHFKRYTMLLDWSEPPTRLKERFVAWLKVHEPQGVTKRSNQGHHKPAELLRSLASYRLAKLPIAKRQIMEGELGIKISDSQLSRWKKRIRALMNFRNYLP